MATLPSYLYLNTSEWEEKIAAAHNLARPCRLCPRRCGADRSAGQTGFCRAGDYLRISSIFPHHGEEPPLSGCGGSGTVFFSHCTLQCLFCQNYQISHLAEGRRYEPQELAAEMIALQDRGCHNVNLVTPSQYVPWILESLKIACERGLRIPVVYNCSGYESVEALAVLKNVVDVYLPDMKYGGNDAAKRYSNAADYVEVNRAAIREMFRQAGPLRLDADGIAQRGLIIRHLVLPAGRAESDEIRRFLSSQFDPHDITVSVMAQYRPLYRACECEEIGRGVSSEEYQAVRDAFLADGFTGYFQDISRLDSAFVIDFKKRKHEALTGE